MSTQIASSCKVLYYSKHARNPRLSRKATFHSSTCFGKDPRLKSVGRLLEDEYSAVRSNYETPRHTIVLTHGLLGFDELHPFGTLIPSIQYWRGIVKALELNAVKVVTASVPPSGSIELRAAKLSETIEKKAPGQSVNIIAHSMGGLDARYMISQLMPDNVTVASLTTIASPHRGATYADYLFEKLGASHVNRIYRTFKALNIEADAYHQLTTSYMRNHFNKEILNVQSVKYFSYGAIFDPPFWSIFKHSHAIVTEKEGPNDGLVSVESSRWGDYRGTLANVSHLDLINWTNRVNWYLRNLWGGKRPRFNAIAFYLDIADMLAKKGL